MTASSPAPAGPPALPRRPGRVLLTDLHAAWSDYRAAQDAENRAWEHPAQQQASGRGDGLQTALYAAAEAQTELAWRRYLNLATRYAREEGAL
jgi:hypothetical protein